MINARELRIGNLVINDCDDAIIELDAIDILTANKDENWLLPIKLFPEILESAGFERVMNEYPDHFRTSILKDVLYLRPSYLDGFYWGIGDDPREFNDAVPIMFVHQLQNLIFSFTGQELEINLQTITKCHTPKTEKK